MSRDAVVFGHMHEDHSAELALAARLPSARCLVIASGGDLALSLAAAGLSVLAVDSNPAQLALVRLKIELAREVGAATAASWMTGESPALFERVGSAGLNPRHFVRGLCFCGRVDRALRRAGPLVAWLLGWPALKPGMFQRTLAASLQRLLPIGIKLLHGTGATHAINARAVALMKRRLLAAMSQSDTARNPLLAATLGRGFGIEPPPVWREPGIRAWLACAANIDLRASTIEAALDSTPPGSLGLISLSNLADLLDPRAWQSLLARAAAALAPGGVVIARSMLHETLPPATEAELSDVTATTLAECGDRSPLCPVVSIGRRIRYCSGAFPKSTNSTGHSTNP